MYKKIKLALLPGIIFSVTSSYSSAIFLDNTLSVSGEAGYTQFSNPSDRTLVISNYLTDLLTQSYQRSTASYSLNAKKQLNINFNTVDKIMLGPAFYFQQARNTGQVWELFSPEFYNYQYNLNSNDVNFLVESDVYFKPVATQITPFLTAGIGFGVEYTNYNDYALAGIPQDSERHWSITQTRAIYEIGAGLAIPVNSHWAVKLRYAYFYKGKADTSLVQYQNINMNLNNQTVFIGINYFL